MLAQFFTIGLIMLLSVMLPGPDFALVTKNTILHSRRAGLFTSLGICLAVLIHITYCVLGLAVIISQSLLLFSVIKYIGAIYLIYLGTTTILTKHTGTMEKGDRRSPLQKCNISDFTAIKQGFVCNLLNPKATLFFLALFTVIIRPETPKVWVLAYVIEMFIIITAWFCSLTFILSHKRVLRMLNKTEKYIEKTVGVFLIGFGVALALVRK
jgi:RhtB (resistance to homoserine/threonine) family protein